MPTIQKSDIFAAKLLLMCFFLPVHLQVYAAIGTCVYFVVRTLAAGYYTPPRNYWWAVLLGAGFLLYLFAVPLSAQQHRGQVLRLVERKSSFFLLPLVFAIMAPVFRQLIIGHFVYFVCACIIVAVLGNLDFLYHHLIVEKGANALSHVHYRMIFERFTGIHPTYMSIYLCFSVCIVLLTTHPETKRGKILKNAVIYVMLLFLLALFAKTPLIAIALIGLHSLYRFRNSLYQLRWVFVSFAALLTGAYFLIPFFRQRAAELLGLFGTSDQADITQNSVSVRKLIWATDTQLLSHYWLTGIGPGRLLQSLNERYFFHSIYRGYWVGYFDPHNQYFAEWISFGLVGFLLLVAALVFQFAKAIKYRNAIYLYLLIILSLTFFTETLLARQQGVIFYAVFTSLLFFGAGKPKDLEAHVNSR
jgi:O-antigen ligase